MTLKKKERNPACASFSHSQADPFSSSGSWVMFSFTPLALCVNDSILAQALMG